MQFCLKAVLNALGLDVALDGEITGWSVDSRTTQQGDLFFALRGINHDGNLFIEDALGRGAVAAIADRPLQAEKDKRDAVFVVRDSLAALQQAAVWARDEWGGDVVAVTGSAGKTSTKDVIAALLAARFPVVGKTTGNLNNHVGLPLSLLRLDAGARVAVLEMGMNHAGEIRDLARIARPRVGVVTNAGYAHIENFASVEDVALAKRELIEALPPDGVAVLNADDARVSRFRDVHPGPVVTFGLSVGADVRGEDVLTAEAGSTFRVGGARFQTPLVGRHCVSNVLAGIAVAGVYGIPPNELTGVVSALAPGKMRGERFTTNGILIFNDCYNSNPDAALAMIDVLRDAPAKRRIAVLGEMLELGHWSRALHRDVGSHVARQGISVLVGIRGEARSMVDAAMQEGLPGNAAFFFEDPVDAGAHLRQIARQGDAILFKGSRGTRVEKALERFLE